MSQIRTNSIVPAGGVVAGASGGGIIQVVTDVVTTTITESVGANTFGSTKILSATITPRSTSSKIIILYTANISVNYSFGGTTLRRGTTRICVGTSPGSRQTSTTYSQEVDQNFSQLNHNMCHVDSPNTTSATEYNVVFENSNNGTNTFYLNRTPNDADNIVLRNRTASNMVLLEVTN
jgi:hypothetical protein